MSSLPTTSLSEIQDVNNPQINGSSVSAQVPMMEPARREAAVGSPWKMRKGELSGKHKVAQTRLEKQSLYV